MQTDVVVKLRNFGRILRVSISIVLCCVVLCSVKMGSPDVLMIEAADKEGNGQQAKWRNGAMEDIVDALPYIDHDYGDPKVKAEVDKLIAEEMRVSSKRPADFLAELPPAPVINLQVLFSPSFPPLHHMKHSSLLESKSPVL